MKNKSILVALATTLTLMTTNSFGAWTKVAESERNDSYYLDFERIRKVNGNHYVWLLSDYLKPSTEGTLSAKTYREVDCALFRYKVLSYIFYREPMGQGTPDQSDPINKDWRYPSPNSIDEKMLSTICRK